MSKLARRFMVDPLTARGGLKGAESVARRFASLISTGIAFMSLGNISRQAQIALIVLLAVAYCAYGQQTIRIGLINVTSGQFADLDAQLAAKRLAQELIVRDKVDI